MWAHPLAITGVTAIRLLKTFFQVVFIDYPLRQGLRSCERPPCEFTE